MPDMGIRIHHWGKSSRQRRSSLALQGRFDDRGDRFRYEFAIVATEGGDLLDDAAAQIAVVPAGHQEHGFYLAAQPSVDHRHLELVLEVGGGSESPHDRFG